MENEGLMRRVEATERRIAKLLKERIGTTFKQDITPAGTKYFVLLTYGKGTIVVYDDLAGDKLFTRVRTNKENVMFITFEQDEAFDTTLVWAVKAIIELLKEVKK